jgi:hypothetical protein
MGNVYKTFTHVYHEFHSKPSKECSPLSTNFMTSSNICCVHRSAHLRLAPADRVQCQPDALKYVNLGIIFDACKVDLAGDRSDFIQKTLLSQIGHPMSDFCVGQFSPPSPRSKINGEKPPKWAEFACFSLVFGVVEKWVNVLSL